MILFLRHLIGWIIGFFRSRQDLILENLALREQLLALKAKRPRRRLLTAHKFFWIALLRLWSRWKQSLVLVTAKTVVTWHRGLPVVLEMAVASPAPRRQNADKQRDSEFDLPHGRGESHLGSAEDPR